MDILDKEDTAPETQNPGTPQDSEALKAANSNRMKEKRAENAEKDKTEEGLLLAIDGAKIKFNAHLGTFKVLNDVPTTQDKLTGTIVEKQIPNFIFDDGFQMISLAEWQDFGTVKVQENYVLLKKSTLPGVGKMPGNVPPETGKIEFVTSGQVNAPESIDGKGAPVPEEEKPDFDIQIIHIKEDFVPLGIKNYKDNKENDKIKFKIIISGKGVNSWHLKIEQKGNLIYQAFSATEEIEEVIVTGKAKNPDKVLPPQQNTKQNERYWPAGEYLLEWDGFDINNIYDSTLFTNGEEFTATIIGKGNQKKKEYLADEFKYKYKQVDWVDAKIDRNNKQINVVLRVSLKDGGDNGIECSEIMSPFEPGSSVTSCPWDKIPKADLISGKPPINNRTRSFADLEKLAIDGLNYHWGRNTNHAEAKYVEIENEKYEVFVNAINTIENSMDDMSLIYNTNGKWMRSGNPGAVTWNPASWIGNLISREAVCYNTGYIKYSNGWGYQTDSEEDVVFKETSAHEMGHEILKFFGGTDYSYEHKGSTYIWQSENGTQGSYPSQGEIDIMPYYENYIPIKDRKRMAASGKDVLGLIWLTKIKIK